MSISYPNNANKWSLVKNMLKHEGRGFFFLKGIIPKISSIALN